MGQESRSERGRWGDVTRMTQKTSKLAAGPRFCMYSRAGFDVSGFTHGSQGSRGVH